VTRHALAVLHGLPIGLARTGRRRDRSVAGRSGLLLMPDPTNAKRSMVYLKPVLASSEEPDLFAATPDDRQGDAFDALT